jgi:hypothetical protein
MLNLSVVECANVALADQEMCFVVREFFNKSDKPHPKILIWVPRKADTQKLKDVLIKNDEVVRALNGRLIDVAHKEDKNAISVWCTVPEHAVLVATSVAGAGVSNNFCDLSVQMYMSYHNDAMLQFMNRSGRDVTRGLNPTHKLIYVQAVLDQLCGVAKTVVRKIRNRAVLNAIGLTSNTTIVAAAISVGTADAVEKYVHTKECRRVFLAKR